MSRVVIQIGEDRVAYDGREWTPVSGERSSLLATILRSQEDLYKRLAAGHRDFTYAVAQAAAEDFRGKIVERQPDPPC
jgi:hypothetical protein